MSVIIDVTEETVTFDNGDATALLALAAAQAAQAAAEAAQAAAEAAETEAGITQLTGDIIAGPGAGSQAATIADGAVTLAKIADQADQTILGNNTGDPAAPVALTASETRTVLGLGSAALLDAEEDTTLSAASDDLIPTQAAVKSYVDAAVSGGGYTDEDARDAVGAALTDSGLVVVTVNDGADTIDINVPAAAGSDFRTGTDGTKALTSDAVWDAAVAVALTDGATVTPDFGAGINFTWTIAGNRTLANPTNVKPGQTGCIEITQDTGAPWLISAYGSNYRFAGGTDIVLSTAAGAIDLLFYYVTSDSKIFLSAQKAIAA
jgi:hypothetical protein